MIVSWVLSQRMIKVCSNISKEYAAYIFRMTEFGSGGC
jgi:hypothetical protein